LILIIIIIILLLLLLLPVLLTSAYSILPYATRRVMCVREIDFVGHFNKDWEYLFENFNRPPVVAGTTLQLYCKVQRN
jgi:hypothetical protein